MNELKQEDLQTLYCSLLIFLKSPEGAMASMKEPTSRNLPG